MLIFGKSKFSVTGLNFSKLLNSLTSNGIKVYDIDRSSQKNITFTVRFFDRAKVIAYLNKMCYNYTTQNDSGVIPFFQFFIKRIGLIVGLIIFFSLTILSSFFVAEVRVDGLKLISDEEISQVLHDIGVREKSLIRLPKEEIERAVYKEFKNTAFVRVTYVGAILKISIVETQPLPVIISKEPTDIVSKSSGKITKLLVYQGTPLVKVGDTVEKGQVIIGGYREAPDGTRHLVKALGEVYGEEIFTHNELFFGKRTVLSRSGKTAHESFIETFGIKFPIKNVQLSGEYETEEVRQYLFYNNILPSQLVTRTHYFLEYITVEENFEDVKKIVVADAEDKAKEKALTRGIIKQVITDIYKEKDSHRIEVKVYIEKSFL